MVNDAAANNTDQMSMIRQRRESAWRDFVRGKIMLNSADFAVWAVTPAVGRTARFRVQAKWQAWHAELQVNAQIANAQELVSAVNTLRFSARAPVLSLLLASLGPSTLRQRPTKHSGAAKKSSGLDIDVNGWLARGWEYFSEPTQLRYAGLDVLQRSLWLEENTVIALRAMRNAAAESEVMLLPVSGFRSAAYQDGLIRRKIAHGQTLEQILHVNAPPGFSEHHSGRAVDITSPGEPLLEESFEATPAFAWLEKHAASFGFSLSYPRGNALGVVYEPWHWCWHPSGHSFRK
jgi:D-alanyl-D-alanine carboxypeptidase